MIASAAGIFGGVALNVLNPDRGPPTNVFEWLKVVASVNSDWASQRLIAFVDAWRTITVAEDEADRVSNGERLP